MTTTEIDILHWLEDVKDPEIPVLSLIDLGVIRKVSINKEGKVSVTMTPTFSGCPAMDVMREDVEKTLELHGITDHEVKMTFDDQWNSNMISDNGLKALKQFGLAPPAKHNLIVDIDIIEKAACPFCNSHNTVMRTPFGPTLCRSIHYCNDCLQAFEQFKPL